MMGLNSLMMPAQSPSVLDPTRPLPHSSTSTHQAAVTRVTSEWPSVQVETKQNHRLTELESSERLSWMSDGNKKIMHLNHHSESVAAVRNNGNQRGQNWPRNIAQGAGVIPGGLGAATGTYRTHGRVPKGADQAHPYFSFVVEVVVVVVADVFICQPPL